MGYICKKISTEVIAVERKMNAITAEHLRLRLGETMSVCVCTNLFIKSNNS